jgi:hypothetical protein
MEAPTPNRDVRVRVYTSVAGGRGRGSGQDAGRVTLVVNDAGRWRVAWGATRTHRTENFLGNLLTRCEEAARMVEAMPQCPKCAGFMVLRHRRADRRQKFWGCAAYPKCNGVKNWR